MQSPSPNGSVLLTGSAAADPLAEIDQLMQNKLREEQAAILAIIRRALW